MHGLVAKDKRFAALSLTLKHDGLKLLCMIRLCPLPYSISNGAMSTVPTVRPLMFALATALASPKLLIHVFIGSRLAAIARSGEKMDAATKAVNYASIVLGGLLGVATGFFIYQRTIARARQLEEEERAALRQAAARGDGFAGFSDEPEERDAAAAILRDDGDDDVGGVSRPRGGAALVVHCRGEGRRGWESEGPGGGVVVGRHGECRRVVWGRVAAGWVWVIGETSASTLIVVVGVWIWMEVSMLLPEIGERWFWSKDGLADGAVHCTS